MVVEKCGDTKNGHTKKRLLCDDAASIGEGCLQHGARKEVSLTYIREALTVRVR